MKSKTSIAIKAVIGKTSEVCELDSLKENLKHNPKSYYYSKKYDYILVRIQTQVLQELKSLEQALKNWDETFVQQNNRIPNDTDYTHSSEFKDMAKKKRIALKLLESWKITVHIP